MVDKMVILNVQSDGDTLQNCAEHVWGVAWFMSCALQTSTFNYLLCTTQNM